MGLYIKGMEMPKNCAGCFLRKAFSGFYCARKSILEYNRGVTL